MNKGKKFDVCLMNPPYGSGGGNNINLRFVEKCINIADKQVVIMPSNFIKRNSPGFKKYQNSLNDYLYEIEEIDSSLFRDTKMQNVAIYKLNNQKHNKLIIKYINGNIEEVKGGILNKDYSGFNIYEKEIIKYLYTDNPNFFIYSPDKNNLKFWIDKYLSKLPDDKVFMLTNSSNGSTKGPWNPCFISSKLGQILNNKKELEEELYKRKGAACTIMVFNNYISAENCKQSLNRSLLRFTLYKTQTDRGLNKKQYSYIPDIDWSNPKTKTDEGLLELCGCPKDKAKEYAEYCKKIIEEVDKK